MVQEKKSHRTLSADNSVNSDGAMTDCSESSDSSMAVEPQQTFFFGAELTEEHKEYIWEAPSKAFDSHDDSQLVPDDDDAVKHVLKFRQIALGRGAKAGERNIVELEVVSTEGEPMAKVIASLSVGVQEMGILQLDFEGSLPITLRLVEGSGPVHITGFHEMFLEYNLQDDGQLDETVDNIEELSEEEEELSPRAAKRQKDTTSESTKQESKAAGAKAKEQKEEDLDDEAEDQEKMEDEEEEEEAEPKPKEKSSDLNLKKAKAKSPRDMVKQKVKAKKMLKKKT